MIELYCDGSCPKPQGPGGWAYVIVGAKDGEIQGAGGERTTTNNRMELMAAIKGLEKLLELGHRGAQVLITSDSQYVIRGLDTWSRSWKMNGWRRRDEDGKWVLIKNNDLWPRLYQLAHVDFRSTFEWVRGHNGHHYNEICDKLAGEQAWAIIDE